ncbi:MAG TPA: hypothetical protein VLF91_03265 [Candidatus Saccharimonadales bacterium]|nr:hypothetical protein [Candidatus Saccharimonadales bacterium]
MITPTSRPLTETPVPGSVDDEYFYRMLSPYALKLVEPYTSEENDALEVCLRAYPGIKDMNFIAVGGGELWELRRALTYAKRYVCIEPLANIFINDSVRYLVEQNDNVSFIAKRFGEVSLQELPEGNSFYMFLFNILAYIPEPIEAINQLIKPGDILFITTWANTPHAKLTRKRYFDHLNEPEEDVIIDPEQTIGLAYLTHFPFHELKCYKRHELVQGAVTDILIIYI